MKKIFISYGNHLFEQSLRRIGKEARALHRYDKVILYRPQDMPECIRHSPLSIFERGGGYWMWKPYIAYLTLKQCDDGDIVEYVDAGCHLQESEEWAQYDRELEQHDAIFFQYRDIPYAGWERYCSQPENNRPQIRHWMKNSCIEFFREYTRSDEFLDCNQIPSGHFLLKRTPHTLFLMKEWLQIMLLHPSLANDAFGTDALYPYPTFNEHRHDQSILTALVFFHQKRCNLLILPETLESTPQHAAVVATRIKDKQFRNTWERFKYFVRHRILDHFTRR